MCKRLPRFRTMNNERTHDFSHPELVHEISKIPLSLFFFLTVAYLTPRDYFELNKNPTFSLAMSFNHLTTLNLPQLIRSLCTAQSARHLSTYVELPLLELKMREDALDERQRMITNKAQPIRWIRFETWHLMTRRSKSENPLTNNTIVHDCFFFLYTNFSRRISLSTRIISEQIVCRLFSKGFWDRDVNTSRMIEIKSTRYLLQRRRCLDHLYLVHLGRWGYRSMA